MLAKNKREAKLITVHVNPVSIRTVLVLFCFYILNIGIVLGRGEWFVTVKVSKPTVLK